MQYCSCLPGLKRAPADPVEGLWRIRCAEEEGSNSNAIAVYAIGGAAFLTAVAAVAALVVYRNRHALGPPGQLCLSSVPTFTVTLQ